MNPRGASSSAWPVPVEPAAALVGPGDDARLRQRDLPVMVEGELERMVGMIPVVRLLGGMLGSLGALAAAASVTLGMPMLTLASTVLSSLILYALWEDTRLAKALELVRRQRLPAAEAALAKLAASTRRSPWQRQRARLYLASLSWRRGDVEQALQWIQARLSVPRRGREDPGERWLCQATEVQLLALAGHVPQAREALRVLPPPAPDEHAELVAAQCALLVAFAADDPDEVRDDLDGWEAMIRTRDGVGVSLGLLAWANAGRGARDRALALCREVEQRADRGHLARHYPRLWQWIERYGEGFHYGRR
ncbi:hypothetical protein [Paraliomyxa miuraensis]|uniref:hypothetical protein n=1 Tax=Paraliomyxa miuraensis TaxID=376150 RepID=UPI002256C058|nr:hypothetical protein [Paraliomyxa miuraensis]MCX4245883.1 hypothetical protein [Paraliomyxa miuraensis]